MNALKVVNLTSESIVFEDGSELCSYHESDCCEHHWLAFKDLNLSDFEGLTFNLSNDKFFRRIKGYGIELIPLQGWSIKIPGYGSNNGYYSDQLDLVLRTSDGKRVYDITSCQEVNYD